MNNFIKNISVDGLHGRISFNISLKPDLNIIYGKNGLGKTTLLHIIANIAEGDLARFNHLNFAKIEIENNTGNKILMIKEAGKVFTATLDGKVIYQKDYLVKDISKIDNLSTEYDDYGDLLRTFFGERPCYLPAFRSVLERTRDIYQVSSEESRSRAYEEIARKEELISRAKPRRRDIAYGRELSAKSTALKTVRCRGWFGNMVPVIRYPSIADVTEGLGEEWNFANYKTGRLEQEQYEQAFLNIFETILLEKPSTTGTGDQTDILSSISQLLNDDTLRPPSARSSSTYDRLVEVARRAGVAGTKYNSVLEIYWKLLQTRKSTRESEFKPIVEFENAVNTFLDGKELKIGSDHDMPERRMIRDSEKVRIYPEHGKSYPLRALSSGERQIATMLFAASRSFLTPGALLIDEPELSLHVDWQRHILKELRKQDPERQIIACTHSPEVGADHKSNILMFRPTVYDNADVSIIDDQLGDDNE